MKIFRVAAAAAIASLCLSTAGHAATVTLGKPVNDGVYTLTEKQIAYLGVPDAQFIAFYGARKPANASFATGDSFGSVSVMATCTAGCGNVVGVLNGANPNLAYTGGYLAALGTTSLTAPVVGKIAEGVALLLRTTGNIVFSGSTFNGGQSRGTFAFEVPETASVPLPATLPLLLAGFSGLAWLRRHRRAA